jgi:DNA-binding NtrC family response regulator
VNYRLRQNSIKQVTALITNVLIIDDDTGVRKMLSTVLENEGYVIEAVAKGKDAIKACRKTPFEVALIDIELPDMKGTELINTLKKTRPQIITIIITGIPSVENAIKAVNERADAYLTKPIEVTDLIKTIARLLQEKSSEYIRIFAEASRAKENTPIFKYNRPDKW